MQIIGIDYDENTLHCGRIQNSDKPEFIKLKHFPNSKKGFAACDAWLDECCSKNRDDLAVAVVVEDQQGFSIAYHVRQLGFAVIPMTYAGVAKSFREAHSRISPCEIIARKAVASKDRWLAPSTDALLFRNALIEREAAKIGCQQNQEKNLAYEAQAFDFLIQLTQNAANIHAQKMNDAENEVRKIVKRVPAFKKDADLIATIPGMNEMTAAVLTYVMHAYPSKSASRFASMAALTGGDISIDNFRAPDLRILRNELYCAAHSLKSSLPAAKALASRLQQKNKPEDVILIAICNKVAKIAFALVKKGESYRG